MDESSGCRGAAESIGRWIRDAPRDPTPYLWKAQLDQRISAGPETLVEDFQQVLRLDSDNVEAHRGLGELLVRQIRRSSSGEVYEARCRYRRSWWWFRTLSSQVIAWGSGPPRLLYEEHVFRDAEEFQAAAPTFFPMLSSFEGQPTLPERWESSWEAHSDKTDPGVSAPSERREP